MRKIFKKLILGVSCFCLFGTMCVNAKMNVGMKPQTGKISIITEKSNEFIIDGGVINKETITEIKHEYTGKLGEIPYKYITIEIENMFLNSVNNVVFGTSKFEVNFRFDKNSGRSECLSVSRGNIINNASYSFETIARRTNKTIDEGCASIKLEFKHRGTTTNKKIYEISCDSKGNIKY